MMSNNVVAEIHKIKLKQFIKPCAIETVPMPSPMKSMAVFVLDKECIVDKKSNTNYFAIHVVDPKEQYMQCIKIPFESQGLSYANEKLFVLTSESKIVVFKVASGYYSTVIESTGKSKRHTEFSLSPITIYVPPSPMIGIIPEISGNSLSAFGGKTSLIYNLDSNSVRRLIEFNDNLIDMVLRSEELIQVVFESHPRTIASYVMENGSWIQKSSLDIEVPNRVVNILTGPSNILYILTVCGQILVHSSLSLGINFCNAVQAGYRSCGYVSDKVSAKKAVKPSYDQTMADINAYRDFFVNWDEEKTKNLKRNTVSGKNGSVISSDIACINKSKIAVDCLVKRLHDIGKCQNMDKFLPYVLINESPIEHGFGNMPQGNSRSLLDYATGQRKTKMNMLFKYTNTPFSLPRQYRKAYMEPAGDALLSYDAVQKILRGVPKLETSPKYIVVSSDISEDNADMEKIQRALNIARAQPRKSTRQQYCKERAGHKPQMLSEDLFKWMFLKYDVVVYKESDGTKNLLAVSMNIPKNDFANEKTVVGLPLRGFEGMANIFTPISSECCSVICDALATDSIGSYVVFPAIYHSDEDTYEVSSQFLDDFNKLVMQ